VSAKVEDSFCRHGGFSFVVVDDDDSYKMASSDKPAVFIWRTNGLDGVTVTYGFSHGISFLRYAEASSLQGNNKKKEGSEGR
jgi:hypothetical protein